MRLMAFDGNVLVGILTAYEQLMHFKWMFNMSRLGKWMMCWEVLLTEETLQDDFKDASGVTKNRENLLQEPQQKRLNFHAVTTTDRIFSEDSFSPQGDSQFVFSKGQAIKSYTHKIISTRNPRIKAFMM